LTKVTMMMALRRAIWITLLLVTAQGCALSTALSDTDEPDSGGASDMKQAADDGADMGMDLPVAPDMPVLPDMQPDMPVMSDMPPDMPPGEMVYDLYRDCLAACPIATQQICVGDVDTAGQPTDKYRCISQDAVAARCLDLVSLPATDLPKNLNDIRSFKPERLLAEVTKDGAIAFTRAGGEAQVVLLAGAGSRRVTLDLPPPEPAIEKTLPVGVYPEAIISLRGAQRPEVLVLGRGAEGVDGDGVSDAGAIWYGAFVNPNDTNLIASLVRWVHSSDSRFCGASGTNSASFSHVYNDNPRRYLGLTALFCNTDEFNRPRTFELQGVDSVALDSIATAGLVSINSFSATRTLSEDWASMSSTRPSLAAVSGLTTFVRQTSTQTWGLVREHVQAMGQVRFKLVGWNWNILDGSWSEERYINLHDAVVNGLSGQAAQGCPANGKGRLVEGIERYSSGELSPILRASAAGDLEVALPYVDESTTDLTPRWLIARFEQDKYNVIDPSSLYRAVSLRCVGPLPPPGQMSLPGNFLVVDHLPDVLGGVSLISERPSGVDGQRTLNVRLSIRSPMMNGPSEPILLFSQQNNTTPPAVFFSADRLLPSEGGGMQIVGRKLTVAGQPSLEAFRLPLSAEGAPLCRPPLSPPNL
jgi:hypothetical protein